MKRQDALELIEDIIELNNEAPVDHYLDSRKCAEEIVQQLEELGMKWEN